MAAVIAELGDGYHQDMRWFVQRVTNADHPVVTITGFIGPRYVHHEQEMPEASPAKVKRLVEQVIAAPAKKARR